MTEPDKFQQKAQDYEEKEAAAPQLFNPAALVESSKKIHEADFPLLGKIRYGELTLDDSFVISKCKDDEDKTCMAAYLMLKKAYPEMPQYTPENIREWTKSMPMAEGAALLLFICGTPAFLRTQSLRGSPPTLKLSKSPR